MPAAGDAASSSDFPSITHPAVECHHLGQLQSTCSRDQRVLISGAEIGIALQSSNQAQGKRRRPHVILGHLGMHSGQIRYLIDG